MPFQQVNDSPMEASVGHPDQGEVEQDRGQPRPVTHEGERRSAAGERRRGPCAVRPVPARAADVWPTAAAGTCSRASQRVMA